MDVRVRYNHGNLAGQIRTLPTVEAQVAVDTGTAEFAPERRSLKSLLVGGGVYEIRGERVRGRRAATARALQLGIELTED